MKNFLLASITLLLVIACSKDSEFETRQLELTFKSASATQIYVADNYFVVYPNPFQTLVNINLGTPADGVILINNDKGDNRKFVFTDTQAMIIDFSKEKSGVYNLELLRNNTVQRIKLIKE